MARVSVVIPCHNGAAFLAQAVDSALAQGMADLEVVVADDGSADASPEIAAAYGPPVRLLRVRHGNTQATRNAAVAASSGDYVALLDQDDRWRPAKLARQLARLDAQPDLALCWTDTRVVDGQNRELPERHNPIAIPRGQVEALGLLLRVNLMAASSVVIRRSALEAAGGFDPAYHLAGDWDLWLRLAERHPIAPLPEVLLDYRWHGGNLSRARIPLLQESIAVQTAALERLPRHPRWGSERALRPYLARARRKLAARWSELGVLHARAGQRDAALAAHARAIALAPLEARLRTRWLRARLGPASPPPGDPPP